jgi:3',5'-cyclic AMP phosphodiesterase CpdA
VHRVLHITDVHLMPEGRLLHGRDPRQNLLDGLAAVERSDLDPDVILLTGDLADSGDAACYEDLAAIMGRAADDTGAQVVYLPGNHDRRSPFRRHLLGGDGTGPINGVHWHGGLRFITLDSTVPGEEAGLLADETLEFLVGVLATPAPEGTILAVHHPPIPSPIRFMEQIMLRDAERLATAVSGSDVRLIVCGHNHHEGVGSVGGKPVWVGPASAYRLDVLSRDRPRAILSSAFSWINVGETVTVSVAAFGPSDEPGHA